MTRYLESNSYEPKPSVQTVSNAMDVGNPSNFIRIQAIYNNNFETLKSNLSSYSFTDDETKQALDEIYKTTQLYRRPTWSRWLFRMQILFRNQSTSTLCVFGNCPPNQVFRCC